MTFAQRVLTGQIKQASVVGLLKGGGKFLARQAASGTKAAWGGTKAAWKGTSGLNKFNVGVGATTLVGTGINNVLANTDANRAIDVKNMSSNWDNTVRPAVGAAMLLGAPVAGYLASRTTEKDDEV